MRSPIALATVLLASAASSQGKVWVVDDDGGPGVDFTVLQDAIGAAADGDLVLVMAGSYGSCTLLNRGLTISAEAGADVSVESLAIHLLSAGKVARIQGLRSSTAAFVTKSAGEVWVEDVFIDQPIADTWDGNAGISVADCPSVVLVDVEAHGQIPRGEFSPPWGYPSPGQGLDVWNSNVSAFDCTFEGGDGTAYYHYLSGKWTAGSGGRGVEVEGKCRVQLSATTMLGGQGSPTIQIGECLPWEGSGGVGLYANAVAPNCVEVALQGCQVLGGPGGPASWPFSCPAGPEGPPFVVVGCSGVTQVGSQALTMTAPSPVGELASVDLALSAPPDSPVLLGVSLSSHSLYTPELGAPLAIAPPYLVVLLGVASPAGGLALSLPLYGLPPGVESMVFHGQGAYLDSLGQGVLGQARMVVVLDDAF